jgi:CBS-domain-containing membrane protein
MAKSVAQWLSEHPEQSLVVEESTSLQALLQQLNKQPAIQDIYVVDYNRHVVGHISKMRIANIVLAEYRRSHNRRQLMEQVATGSAGELMERHFPVARLDQAVDSVIYHMLEHQLQDLAVLDEKGQFAGTINMTTLLQAFT